MEKQSQYFSFRRNLLAWFVSALSLLATVAATVYTKRDIDADAQKDFEFACDEIRLRIDARMQAHAQILRSGAALFQASRDVTRHEWHIYNTHQNVDLYLPGIQGIGFAKLIRPEELNAHVESVRAEGFPNYQVTPVGRRSMYTAIVFLEPFSERNRRAFGYDMYSHPVRRKAMAQARDYNVAALSGRVTLLQETNTDIQAGTLMYVPVYETGIPLDTVANRRAALRGWVYSPYRMQDLMNGILRKRDLDVETGIRLQVFDKPNLRKESLMYDSVLADNELHQYKPDLTLVSTMNFNGTQWYLKFFWSKKRSSYPKLLGVAMGGTLISLLLFVMIYSLLSTRQKARQIAEQLKVEARLEALNQQLQKNESLHRMAGAIAHHFNNKLGAVMGNIDIAIEDLSSDSPVLPMLESALVAASDAAEVSGKMLTYLGQSAGSPKPQNFKDVVQAGLPLLRSIAPKGINLSVDLPEIGPTVCVDLNQIQQILTNLTTNAFEAVDTNNGRVHIAVKTVSSEELPTDNHFPINWKPDAPKYALLQVSDDGCGIARSEFNKLFDPFFSSRFTGRGLGLAAVLGIVRSHGGVVAVESVVEIGSIFRVFFPLCNNTPSVESMHPPVVEESTPVANTIRDNPCETVLLVEDEASLLEMTETMLIRLGYRVLSAVDGEDAVQVFKRHADKIGVVLCDLSMPRMDGFETMEMLRQMRPNIPVILTSGHIESFAMAGARKEQPQVFLHKPYKRSDLEAALKKACTPSHKTN